MPDSKRLTVAVIIPTYNRADFLPETLDSLLNQTRVPDEIIVVDDGSTDNTTEVLARYAAPVIVIRQANNGAADARNTGMAATQCDLIAFLDSDDLLTPESIAQRARALETRPAIDVVYSDVLMANSEGKILGRYSQIKSGQPPSGDVFVQVAQENLMPVHGFMIRRVCLDEHRFDSSIIPMEDYDLWRQLSASYQFHYLDEPLAIYRMHKTMITRQQWPKMVAASAEIMTRFRQMPVFDMLPAAEKAAIYRAHGKRYAYMGRLAEARHNLRLAMQHDPGAIQAYGFWLLTWVGRRAFGVILSIPDRLKGTRKLRLEQSS